MSGLTNSNGTHEQDVEAARWMDIFYPVLSKMLSEQHIIGLEMGADYYKFRSPETARGKDVTIKFIVE